MYLIVMLQLNAMNIFNFLALTIILSIAIYMFLYRKQFAEDKMKNDYVRD